MLFFIEHLGAVQRDLGHGAEGVGHLVLAVNEDGVVEAVGEGGKGPNGLAGIMDRAVLRQGDDARQLEQLGADLLRVAVCNDVSVRVDQTDLPIRGGLELLNDVCKNMVHDNPRSLD